MEKNLKEKEVYISNIKCILADLSGRVNEIEGKVCCCNEGDIEVKEVENDSPTSELSYETVYHTPVAIVGLLEDIPNQLVPIGDLEITPGGFEEEVRNRDEDSNQELELVTSKVAEKALEEDGDHTQVRMCFSCLFCYELTSAVQIQSDEESSDGTDVEHFMYLVGPVCLHLAEESKLTDHRILVQSQRVTALSLIPSRPMPSFASSTTQTVVQTYADVSVEVVNVQCMPRGEFRQLVQETVQENGMFQVLATLQQMQSSVEAAVAGTELLLNMELARVQTMQTAFIPIIVEGNVTPKSDKGGHLTEEGEEEAGEGIDGEETSL